MQTVMELVCAIDFGLGATRVEPHVGGFSGAKIFRIQTVRETLCLKAWPSHRIEPARLAYVHQHQETAGATLPFVPRLWRSVRGTTVVQKDGFYFELSDWRPGLAD